MKTVACILNECSETTIPIENFILLNDNEFHKCLVVFNATQQELLDFFEKNYPQKKILLYGLGKLTLLQKFFKTKKILKQTSPYIVHAHHTSSAALSYLAKIGNNKIKFIFTLHSCYDAYNFKQKLVYIFLYQVADKLIANSKNTKKSIPNVIKKEKIEVIYNGVDIEKLKYSNQKYLGKNTFSFGTISRLTPQKDHVTLIKAFAKFVKENNLQGKVKLYIVGDGYLKQNLLNLVNKLNINSDTVFTGLLSRWDAYSYLKSFDIYVVSSIFEGFCNSMVEAMFAKKLIISSDIDPFPEVLGEGNGLFFKVKDAEDLALKMKDAYEEKLQTDNMAHEYAMSNYTLEICVKKHEKLYEKLTYE